MSENEQQQTACQCRKSRHPESVCQRCGRDNVTWFAPNEIWNEVNPVEGILCLSCFTLMARESGADPVWKLTPESEGEEQTACECPYGAALAPFVKYAKARLDVFGENCSQSWLEPQVSRIIPGGKIEASLDREDWKRAIAALATPCPCSGLREQIDIILRRGGFNAANIKDPFDSLLIIVRERDRLREENGHLTRALSASEANEHALEKVRDSLRSQLAAAQRDLSHREKEFRVLSDDHEKLEAELAAARQDIENRAKAHELTRCVFINLQKERDTANERAEKAEAFRVAETARADSLRAHVLVEIERAEKLAGALDKISGSTMSYIGGSDLRKIARDALRDYRAGKEGASNE